MRKSVDALAEIEDELELSGADPLDPATVGPRGNPNGFVAERDEFLFDSANRLTNEKVGRLARLLTVEQNGDSQ